MLQPYLARNQPATEPAAGATLDKWLNPGESLEGLNVCAVFSHMAHRQPDAPALIDTHQHWTYGALNERAQAWAQALRNKKARPQERVLIALSSIGETVACMLGCLAKGLVYVVVDPKMPDDYLRAVIDDTAPVAIACDQPEKILLREYPRLEPDPDALPETPVFAQPQLAYIAYTSGTTGKPKGVMHTHANILHEARTHRGALRIETSDRLSGFYKLSTVGAVRDVFAALLSGAVYCPFAIEQHSWQELSRQVETCALTIVHVVPPIFRAWMTAAEQARFPQVRVVFLAGDSVRAEDVATAAAHFPHARFFTGLGASETSSLYVHGFVAPGLCGPQDVLPSGQPIAGIQVALIDTGEPAGKNQPGEIVVTGRYFSPGYWQNPEATAQKFHHHPDGKITYRTGDLGCWTEQGWLCHLGRIDRQLKINGVRLEPAGIESALRSIPGISEAIVRSRRQKNGEPALVAWLETDETSPRDAQLREALRQQLPDNHIPRLFVRLPRLPLNRNGKIDLRALPEPETADTPGTPEDALEQLFRSLLPPVSFSRHLDFRALGGDSLGLVNLATALQQQWGLHLPSDFWNQVVSVETVQRQLAESGQTALPSPWPTPLGALAGQWPLPTGAEKSRVFPGYRMQGNPESPLLLWLASTPAEYALPSRVHELGERWVLASPYPVLPTKEKALSDWLPQAADWLAGELRGRQVLVGGYCGSGSLAVLLGTLLLERGVVVQAALALEAFGGARATRRFFYSHATWLNTVQQMKTLPVRRWPRYLVQKGHRFVRRLRNHATPATPGSVPHQGRHRFGLEAIPAFAPPLYLVVTRASWLGRLFYPRFGWSRKNFPHLRITHIDGNHFTLLFVNEPARLFSPLLETPKSL